MAKLVNIIPFSEEEYYDLRCTRFNVFPLSTLNWVRIDSTQACSSCGTEVSCFLNNMILLAPVFYFCE
jgi:hypothetical protein